MAMLAAPLVNNPVAIFLIVLVIILLAPVLLNKLKIPHIIGMIVAGVVVGPYGFNVLADDSSFEIFGQVGLLYLMFLAGIEIDIYHLKKNLRRGLLFGLLTFLVPMALGVFGSVYLLHIDWITSTLLASMYASHTLISYPVVARLGIGKSPAVMFSVVGTIVAVVGALLVLGAVVNVHDVGYVSARDMGYLLLKVIVYCVAVMLVYPKLTRWFLRNYVDAVTQFVFILALVFLSAYISKLIGLESVLGAFYAGLVLNRFVPASSPLMSRIEFLGNAIFIPYFLIGVGMMINVHVIVNPQTLFVTAIMLAIAIVGKWLAAWIAQKCYGMDRYDRRVMFGLTTAHTAVALAVVTIGYNMVGPDGHRLMDETILNGTVLVILITCALAPIVTGGAATHIKMRMLSGESTDTTPSGKREPIRTLVAVNNPITAGALVEFAMLTRPENAHEHDEMFAVNVRNDNETSTKLQGRNALNIADRAAAAANSSLTTIDRYDHNTITGLVNTILERDINQVFLWMHRKTTAIDSFYGTKIEQLLKLTNRMVVISRCYIPVNTVRRIVVYVPPKAQFETGFKRWLMMLFNLTRELSCRLIVCCPEDIEKLMRSIRRREKVGVRLEFRRANDRDDLILLANRVLEDDLFVVISARSTSVSFSSDVMEMPTFLQKNFSKNNIVVIYPEQFGDEPVMETFADPLSADITSAITPVPWFVRARHWWHDRRARRSDRNLDL